MIHPIRLIVSIAVATLVTALCPACLPRAEPGDFRTRAERTGYVETARYDEVVDFCRRLERASPCVRMVSIGVTGEGRDMPLLVVSRDRAFTPQAARKTGKPIILVTNGIHAGEIEGKDASLSLVRDLVFDSQERFSPILDRVILLVLPIFNIDGHERVSPHNRINQNGPCEMGWRCTAAGLNLNRDFMKADAVETHAWLRMYHAWLPHLFFDNHTTDGADYQYDVTFALTGGPEAAPSVAEWVNTRLQPCLFDTLPRDGHVPQLYFDMRDRLDPCKGINCGGGFAPRFSTGYGAITNRPSILIETHMLKPYRQRVEATYRLMLHTLELIASDPAALTGAVAAADRWSSTLHGAGGSVVLTTSQPADDPGEPITFHAFTHQLVKSEASGVEYPVWDRDKPLDLPSRRYAAVVPDVSIRAPRAYIVPPQWTDVIDRIRRHGLHASRLSRPLTLPIVSVRFHNVTWTDRPFEGRHAVSFAAEPLREVRTFPAGSLVVAMDQPMSRVAAHLLDPAAPDALVRWGFFDTIFEQKEYAEDYCMAPIADRMLRDDPSLKARFDDWLKTHPDQAGNPRARLHFFYENSPWWDARKDVYPVAWTFDALPVDALD